MGGGDTCENFGSYECYTQYVPESYEIIFVRVSYFLLLVFALKVVRGDDLWPHLKMCTNGSHLLPVILNYGTMSDEMRSQVGLMPMVIKFGPSDWGHL